MDFWEDPKAPEMKTIIPIVNGIFSSMSSYTFKANISKEQLDIMFISTYGKRNPSPVVDLIAEKYDVELDETLPATAIAELAQLMLGMYKPKWDKLGEIYDIEYDPAIIGKDAEVRHCAFIRGNAIVGEGAVVGNSTELKNVLLFNKVQVPHYNYVGDSILGFKSHMGAGSITSNVKSDKTLVTILCNGEKIETNLKKMGAILGDNVEVGCNSVLNPGTIVGKESNVYPLSMVRGYVNEKSIYKNKNEVVEKQ